MEWDIPQPMVRLKHGTLLFYYISFIIITVLTVLGLLSDDLSESLVGLPMVFILGITIFSEKKNIHVPPEMVVFVVLAFFLAFVSRTMADDTSILRWVADIITGINLGLLGLILVYTLLKSMPGARNENRWIVSFIVVCISIASYMLMMLISYYLTDLRGMEPAFGLDDIMTETVLLIVGTLFVCIGYTTIKGPNIFGGIVNSFLEENSEIIGLEDMERTDILNLIENGESEWLEFKSTLRTNLQTGETDKRMEKAALKTIVAFLNSDGGNLLIGVADDGSVIGSDVQSFENKDKMGLHLSNLISSQIGSPFLPNISFHMVDFDDKTVIRVTCTPCEKPVFLKDGKVEMFYIRKGPQSEELTGMTLINYVNNRKRQMKNSKKFN